MQYTRFCFISRRGALRTFAVLACLATAALNPAQAEIAIQDGQKLAFMGDSITQGGWSNPGGYVRLVLAGLAANGVKVIPVPAGISGHKSDQMLERLRRDVLDKKPDWMTLSCGVNDVWHGERGVALEPYKTNITAIIDHCQAAGVKVNAVLDNELTLLMWAAGSGQDKMVQFLLAQGAEKGQKDNRGLTALAIARDAKQDAAIALLE